MPSKKSFKADINPAMQFISQPIGEPKGDNAGNSFPSEPRLTATGKPPEGYKLNPLYIEVKNKRVQLLMKPSIYAKTKTMADRENRSVNDMIHYILEEATREGL